MAESFVAEITKQVLGKLATISSHEIGKIWNVKSELKRLESTLTAIRAVLWDAEEQQAQNQQVRDWLEKLDDVLYDVDDVLDDFMTEDLRRELKIKGSKLKKVLNFFSSSNPIKFRATMSSKIEKIRERLEEIAADRRNFQFAERTVDTQFSGTSREQTHSFVRASDVIGRDHDKEEIIKLLLSSNAPDNNLCVLPIVGLGGLGKTTLAKFVYNDERIVQDFQKKIWVCVSEDFDLKKLIEKILDAATGVNNAHLNFDQVQTSLRDHLKSKKFLLVLDDVWNEDPKKWVDLRDLVDCGVEGCKIVVTTRSKTIADIMGTVPPYHLKVLSDDECLSIFLKCALKEGQERENPKLVEIGKAIVKKCGGVPLAVRTLGSLLYTKTEEHEWLHIRDNDMWKIAQRENDILPILRLSYDKMPRHLKPCFACCSILPKGCEIGRTGLIYHWIALGLIESSDGSRKLEDIGNQYFNELLSRSFFQDVEYNFESKVWRCKMHDLVVDLAQSVAGTDFFKVDSSTKPFSERVRHLLFCEENLQGKELPGFLLKQRKVRLFRFNCRVGCISKTFLDMLIRTFVCVRVLELAGSEFEELPSSIGTLKHLRYLSLFQNRTINTLPDSICNLLNLQILDLGGCVKLKDLPKDIGNLWSLRHLCLTSEIVCLPEKGLQGLKSLQSLSIEGCCRLESLSDGMQYLTSLRKLVIAHCPCLTSLPNKSMSYLTSFEQMRIMDCERFNLEEESLEGLSRLQSLALYELPNLRKLPCGIQQAASTLKYLRIMDCPSFETLPASLENCTSLSRLAVINCPRLEFLPSGMHQLTALRVLALQGCHPDLIRRCERETGENWPSIRHIPEIYIPRV